MMADNFIENRQFVNINSKMQSTSSTFQQKTTKNSRRLLSKNKQQLQEENKHISNFYRSPPDPNDISPSHSTNTNTLTKYNRRPSKGKQSHSNQKPDHTHYFEAATKNQSQSETITKLRTENAELKQKIIELRVSEFYQFDDGKLKTVLGEIEDLKEELKSLKELNGILKLENDFLNKTNLRLKQQLVGKAEGELRKTREVASPSRYNPEEIEILSSATYLGRKPKPTSHNDKISNNHQLHQIRSMKALKTLGSVEGESQIPERERRCKRSEWNPSSESVKVDIGSLAMNYKKKRMTAISEPENQLSQSDRE